MASLSAVMDSTSATARREPRHFDFVDSLRGIAAMGVILVHVPAYRYSIGPRFVHMLALGQYGVQLFFLASAFTLFLSLQQRRNVDDTPFITFWIRRFFRIAPMYWSAILFYGLLSSIRPEAILKPASPAAAVSNLLFIHAFNPRWIMSSVPGGWSIGIEMAFYVLVPFLFLWITTPLRAVAFFLFTLLLHVGITLPLAHRMEIGAMVTGSPQEWFYYLYLPSQLPVFALGFIFFTLVKPQLLISSRPPLNRARTIQAISYYLAAVAILGLVVARGMRPIPFAANWHHIFCTVGFLFLGLGLWMRPTAIIVNPLTRYLGRISYSIYLNHPLWLYLCFLFLPDMLNRRLARHAYLEFAINWIVAVGLTVASAEITYRWIEQPGIRTGKALITSLKKRRMERTAQSDGNSRESPQFNAAGSL